MGVMNEYQKANMALDILLGPVGRAVWLSRRVDGKSLGEIAGEFDISIGRVKEILETCDFALQSAEIVPPAPPPPPAKTAWEGFHQEDPST